MTGEHSETLDSVEPQALEAISALTTILRGGQLSDEAEVVAVQLLGLALNYRKLFKSDEWFLLKTATDCLGGTKPNVAAAKSIYQRLLNVVIERSSRFFGFFIRWFGHSALSSVLFGALAGALIWGALFLVASLVASVLGADCVRTQGGNPIGCPQMDGQEVRSLVLASFLGSLVSILSRLDAFEGAPSFNPLLLMFNSMLKPAIASILALVVFSILKSKFLTINGLDIDDTKSTSVYILWVLGFLCGFSERFTSDLIGRAEGSVPKAKG